MLSEAILTRADLQKMSGASPSTISRACKRRQIRGAYRGDGLHWLVPMSPAVKTWCDIQRNKQKLLRLPKGNLNKGLGKGTAITTIEGIRQSFDLWHRKVQFDQYSEQDLDKAITLLEPIELFIQALRDRRKAKSPRILR